MKKKNLLIILTLALLTILTTTTTTQSATVSGNNSIYDFQIQNCTAQPQNVSCASTQIMYQCNITPSTLIDTVQFYIEGTYYTATQNATKTDYWYYYYTKSQDLSDTTTPVSMTKQKIFDVDTGYVIANQVVNVNRTCDVCDYTLTQNCDTCNVSDQQYCQYTSSNTTCLADFNQTETCNYCTPSWTARTGGIYDCQENNTKFVFYDDFASCYSQTGLASDGPPSDHNTTVACNYLTGDFNCTMDPEPYLENKMNIICQMPAGANNYKCNTYVKKNVSSNVLLQVNPEYKKLGSTITGFFAREEELRTSFENEGLNLNAYITDKNLQAQNDFVVSVKCSTNTTSLEWQQEITPVYKDLRKVTDRFIWLQGNFANIILAIAGIVVIIVILVGLIALARR